MAKNNLLSAKTKDRYITYAMLAVIFAAVQAYVSFGSPKRSFIGLLVPTCVYILAAISLNLVVGVSGELSLGQAGFMCIGAFTGSLFSLFTQAALPQTAIRFPLALLVSGVVAAFFGFIIGIPVLRLRGDYLAIVTLAFGEIIKSIFNNLYIVTDNAGLHVFLGVDQYNAYKLEGAAGECVDYLKGASGISIPTALKNSTFAVCMIAIIVAMIVFLNFMDSKQGRAVMASRDNRIAAEAMGVNVTRAKMTAFVLSAFFAGVAGALYSHNFAVLQAKTFDYNLSILILVFVVLGGMSNMRSIVISTSVLYILPEALRALNKWRMLMYAIVLISVMLINNSAAFKNLLEKFRSKSRKTGGAA